MRVAFAGTPPFAARALEALVAAGHEVPLVLTQPDRPAGRGLKLTPSDVARAATAHGLAVLKPSSLRRDPAAAAALRSAAPDVLVVAAYGLLLPPEVLAIPAGGCLNIHASLLPRWRGAAPIQRAILAGDEHTGITIMRMEEGLDTGPMLLRRPLDIAPTDTTGSLTDKLADVGASAIVDALARLDVLKPEPQVSSEATYAPKVLKPEAQLDWTEPASQLARKVRAFNPAPGAEASLRGERIKIWEAEARDDASGSPPGTVVDSRDSIGVACGSGVLVLRVLQRPGRPRLSAPEFLRGWAASPASLESPK